MLASLDLFSGIGGISLALSQWAKPVAYCEIEKYAVGVLLSRMSKGELPLAPIWDDIKTLRGHSFKGFVDIVYGGFPCQDISIAGNGKGLAGERSGLFFEILRLSEEIQPTFVFLENVPAIRTRGLSRVIQEFTQRRYDLRWTMLSAKEVGANHKRERWFMLAKRRKTLDDSEGVQMRDDIEEEGTAHSQIYPACDPGLLPGKEALHPESNSTGERSQRRELPQRDEEGRKEFMQRSWWETEPPLGRMANGLPYRVDRLRTLGNAVVPLQVKTAFKRLMGIS